IPEHEGPDFQRFEIVCVVISGTESVCAKNDAALHFLSKTVGSSAPIHFLKRRSAGSTRPVADAIESSKIRTGFGCRDQVISRYRVLGMRQADLLNFAPETFIDADTGLDLRLDLVVESADKVLLWNSDACAFNRRFKVLHVVIDSC